MATTIGSVTDMKGLATSFQTAITAIVDAESEPMKRVQTQRDAIDIRRGIYTDIKTNLDALQGAVQALISSNDAFGFGSTAKGVVTPGTAGATVLSTTMTDSAPAGEFDFSVTTLAKAQSRTTAPAAGSDLALGKSGTFWMGGSGTAAASLAVASDSLTAVATSTVVSGQRELGTGTYSLQSRDLDGVRQFRLVDADGNAVSVRSKDSSTYTTNWQTASAGTFDTGRGLTMTLTASGTATSTDLSYTAKGVSIDITATDTQRSIATKINGASQPDGHALKASIVSGRLVINAAQTGVNHAMTYTDGANLGFGADVQVAQNAVFTVNGLSVSRATNSGLTDVVEGATISLASDAEGKTAHLSVGVSPDKSTAAMNAFVTKFNAAFTHLTNKMALTSSTTGAKTTYTRGPLAGDNGFRSLRTDLYNQMNRSFSNSGSLTALQSIGLSYDKDMKLTLDATKFTDALKTNSSDVTALLDTAMGQFNTLLTRYAGSKGSVQSSLTSIDSQIKGFDQRISKYAETLTSRRKGLIDQYFQYQTQLADIGYEAQMFGINLTGSTSSSSVNILG